MTPRDPLLQRARWSAHVALHAPFQGRFPFRSPEAIARVQRRRLRDTVVHACRHVPYYRETMRRLGLRPEDMATVDDLARLPLIERAQLQRDPEYFRSRALSRDRYVELRSGGSSGEPLAVYHDPFALFAGACHRERRRALVMHVAGRRVRLRELTVASPISSGRDTQAAFDLRSMLPAAVRVVRHRASMLEPMESVVELMNELEPDTLSSYGSYVEALFLHLHRSGRPFHRPRAVLYGADALSDRVRRLITETYDIPVLSAYGAIEAFHIGFECDHHSGFHLNSDAYPVRIIAPSGEEAPDGESGEVVVSNLVNRGTVLLNYRLGDIASRRPVACPCGRNLPLLSYLEGRADDWLQSASGELVHPQAVRTLFTNEEAVWRYQVVQHDLGVFDVAAVVADGCDREALRERLEQRFAARLGASTTTRVRFVETLPTTAGGKVRPVVSLCSTTSEPEGSMRTAGAASVSEPPPEIAVEPATRDDRDAILAVMETANMHHVPSPEMDELDLERFFVARVGGRIVGAAGYELLGGGRGKTTLLAVVPDLAGRGVGSALQEARLDEMARFGVVTVTTNADRPATIAWYRRRFGYRVVGEVEKLIAFGDPDVDRWTTLELDLAAYQRRRGSGRRRGGLETEASPDLGG